MYYYSKNNSKKILILTTEGVDVIRGGLGVYIKELQKRLSKNSKWNIKFYELDFDKKYITNSSYDPILTELIKESDVVHANDYFTGYVSLLRKKSRNKIITTIHMLHQKFTYFLDNFILNEKEIRYLENIVLTESDYLIAVSKFIKKELESLNLKTPNIFINYNGASNIFFKSEKIGNIRNINLCFLGRLIDQKGSKQLAFFLRNMSKLNLPVYIDIYGDGPDRKLIEDIIYKYQLSDRCNLFAWLPHDQVANEIIKYDAVLSFSQYEPFGIFALESIASGVPVLGHIVGGMKEFCKNHVNSIQIRYNDIFSWQKNLSKFITRGKKFVQSDVRKTVIDYSWDSTVDNLIKIYSQVG